MTPEVDRHPFEPPMSETERGQQQSETCRGRVTTECQQDKLGAALARIYMRVLAMAAQEGVACKPTETANLDAVSVAQICQVQELVNGGDNDDDQD